MIGKHSGSAAITAMLDDLSLPVNSEELSKIVSCVRVHALNHKGPVSGDALTSIWRDVREQSAARNM